MTISNISSKAAEAVVTKFHIESLGVGKTKICLKRQCHMINMVTRLIYGKSL